MACDEHAEVSFLRKWTGGIEKGGKGERGKVLRIYLR